MVALARFDDDRRADFRFQLEDFPFRESLLILRVDVFGIFGKVAHRDGFFQTLRDFETFRPFEVGQFLLHFVKIFLCDVGLLHFRHDSLSLSLQK